MKKKTARKPKTKRSGIKYPALDPLYNTKVRRENIDYDYIKKLNEEEKAWLNKFTEEYNNASFKNDGTDLHNTQEMKRDCYRRNNYRNRCLYGVSKANGRVVDATDEERIDLTFEERVNESIDKERELDVLHELLEVTEEAANRVDSAGYDSDDSPESCE